MSQPVLLENRETILAGQFEPLGAGKHHLWINWGDGTYTEETLLEGETAFRKAHTYLDDRESRNALGQLDWLNPTAQDVYPVEVLIKSHENIDLWYGATTSVTVQNVAPHQVQIQTTPRQPGFFLGDAFYHPADEPFFLEKINIQDDSPSEQHLVVVDWGHATWTGSSGTVYPGQQVFVQRPLAPVTPATLFPLHLRLPGQEAVDHQYLVAVTIADDDQPDQTRQVLELVTARSLPPALRGTILPTPTRPAGAPIGEGTTIQLQIDVLRGQLATWPSVTVNWGDGSAPEQIPLVNGQVLLEHTYPNNKPGDAPYVITLESVAIGFEAHPLTATVEVPIVNVAAHALTVDLLTENLPANQIKLDIGFADPGVLDGHTVRIDWADGSAIQEFVLLPGVLVAANIAHTYTVAIPENGFHVQITVHDTDQNPNLPTPATGKVIYVRPRGQTEVPADYYTRSEQVTQNQQQDNTVLGTVFTWISNGIQLAHKLFLDGAKIYLNFARGLAENLIPGLRELGEMIDKMANDVGAFLQAFISNTSIFLDSVRKAGTKGLKDYVTAVTNKPAEPLFGWLSQKVGPEFNVTPEDLPSFTTESVSGFVLKMLGLGWDDLQGEMVEKLGVNNISMLDDAYESIEKWLETPAGIFNAINDLVTQANERMKADQLYGEALDIGKTMLLNQLVSKVPGALLEKLMPASGGFSSLIKTVYWLVRNGQDLLTVGTRLVSQAPNLTDPSKVNEVAGVVTDALKKVTVAMLDFAAVQIGVAKLPTDIGNALRGIRDKVQKRIQPLWSSVLDKGKKVRDQLVNAPPKADEASVTTGDIRGLIGKAVRVEKQNGQIHMLWASYNNGKIDIWMKNCAGEKQNLKELITKWEKGATKEEKADLEKVKESYQSLMKALQPLEKKMLEFEPKLQAAKGQREKAKVQAQYLKAIKKLDKGEKALDELDNRLEVFGANAKACFAAGTPLLTPYGSKAIEKFVAGDEILSRDEYNPDGPVLGKIVEEVFERTGPVLNLHVAGQVIRTSGEHPFFVVGKGWTPANELQPGDVLVSHDGQQMAVEEVYETGEWETLYNLRVSDFHTYFVGTSTKEWSLWAHNQYKPFFIKSTDLVASGLLVVRNGFSGRLNNPHAIPSTLDATEVMAARTKLRAVTNYVLKRIPEEMQNHNACFCIAQVRNEKGTIRYRPV